MHAGAPTRLERIGCPTGHSARYWSDAIGASTAILHRAFGTHFASASEEVSKFSEGSKFRKLDISQPDTLHTTRNRTLRIFEGAKSDTLNTPSKSDTLNNGARHSLS